MIITHKHLPRRTFLRGLGAAVGLPFLDAMSPARAAAVRHLPKHPVRLAFCYVPNGIIMQHWTPAGGGLNYDLTRILKPLTGFRQDIMVLSGLADHNGNALGDGAGGHARGAAGYLTGVHPKKTAGADIQAGVSADQLAAGHLASTTRFPSIELGCEDSRTVGSCDSGYSCAYTNSISWRTPTLPMPPEINPRLVFDRLFGSVDARLSPEARLRRERYRKSILDVVSDDTRSLEGTLGASDRRKIDEYLTAVREVEKRIEGAEKSHSRFMPPMEEPAGIPVLYSDYVKLMFDLQVMAFQADLTRVATFMMGREGSTRTYGEIGIPDPHHPLSHHRGNPEWIEKVARINTFHVEMFAYFLGKLRAAREGGGSLLDHSMIVYGSGLSDGNQHLVEDLPILVAGRGGSLKPGRHVVYKKNTPLTNLFLTLLDCMGIEAEAIGDSKGKLGDIS